MILDADTCHAACDAKDRRFDGRFYVGVKSTGIYCRCICPARTPKRVNRTFWPSAAAAYARIEAGALEEAGLEALADELGVTSRHLRRVMNAQFGASPIDIAQTGRL